MDDSKDYIKLHIEELYKLIRELENKQGMDKEILLDFLTVITSTIVKLNQDIKKLA